MFLWKMLQKGLLHKITCSLPRPPPSPAQATQASAGTAPPLAFTQLTQSESFILFSETLCCPQKFSIWVTRDPKWQGTTSQGTRCSCEYNVSTAPPLAFTQLTQSERSRLILLHGWWIIVLPTRITYSRHMGHTRTPNDQQQLSKYVSTLVKDPKQLAQCSCEGPKNNWNNGCPKSHVFFINISERSCCS